MKYIKEFKNSELAKKILDEMVDKVKEDIRIMEVCGTHTMAIFKNGIRNLLPENIDLISGPGCPVCVTCGGYIDAAIDLSRSKDVIIATFGDMMKVPGTYSSLKIEKALGRDIRVVISPLKALEIAYENPRKEVVFLGVGFETTAPIIALSIYKAEKENIENFSVLQAMKTIPNAIRKLVLDKEIKIDGFLCPGHVSSVIGARPFEFLAKEFKFPGVIAGFEYCDVISAIYFLVKMINEKEFRVMNIYSRIVKYEGNTKAIAIINEVFDLADSMWRGLGVIENTGFRIKERYKKYDAQSKFKIEIPSSDINSDCLCGEILRGLKRPTECKLFSKVCSPTNPVGPCMITQEGICMAYYKYNMR
ncbi:hydrogenase formation protein HypD [Maledivibacter halophilus]|uniref:Hydrogenase maturation protein HypD n=1 Tax=Maledivibacter halophilus TaxID=36842 RepID=A0A1T5L9U0_9FIRM|nr:hydrogenase formation protein HypD [Maledivibacter halophilus]SKC72684.1 Hydrogenase maturation protein HypD [Maledivibacter halophilus]